MYRFKLKEIEVGDVEVKSGKQSTVTDIDDTTGTITWDVEDVADFSSTYKELEQAKNFLRDLEQTGKAKDDIALDKLDDELSNIFNKFRTHIRKNYPEEYERVLRLKESVNEQSEQWTQLDVININKSLRLALKTFNNLVRNLERLEGELGKHSNKPQGNLLQGMAPDSFDYMGVQNKLNKLYNAFSNAFSIDESINEGHGLDQVDLDYLQHIADKNPDDTKLEKIVKFLTNKGKEVKEGEGIGYLTPRAFNKNKKSTGAADIYYYKLGFKPVPKTKPKGFEVKQLFEFNDMQKGRISGFDEVEEKVNSISALLSNAKNETIKYYNENPGSYAVVYSTDMISELLDDITKMLKQSE